MVRVRVGVRVRSSSHFLAPPTPHSKYYSHSKHLRVLGPFHNGVLGDARLHHRLVRGRVRVRVGARVRVRVRVLVRMRVGVRAGVGVKVGLGLGLGPGFR